MAGSDDVLDDPNAAHRCRAPGQLDGIHRIPTRQLMDAFQHRPRDRVDDRSHHLADGVQWKWAQLDALDPFHSEDFRLRDRFGLRPLSGHQADRLGVKPTQGVAQRS